MLHTKKNLIPFFIALIGIFAISCTKEDTSNHTPENNGTLMSDAILERLSKAEELINTQLSEDKLNLITIDTGNTDIQKYRFELEVTDGSSTGLERPADLTLMPVFEGEGFKIFRGSLVFDDETESEVFGVLTGDNEIFIFTRIPDLGYLKGFGNVGGGQMLSGSFLLITDEGRSSGDWSATPMESELPTLAEIINTNPNLSILSDALVATNLIGAISGEGSFTVFAPTNEAFEMLDEIPEGEALREVLLYHLVPGFTGGEGTFDVDALLAEGSVTTTQGQDITIELRNDSVLLNGTVEIAVADIKASNGFVHIIKTVLVPESEPFQLKDAVEGNPDLSIFYNAAIQTGIDSTVLSSITQGYTVFAPTNKAFEALENLPQGSELIEFLRYHVAPGAFQREGTFTAEELVAQGIIDTLTSDDIVVEMVDGKVILNGSVEIITKDILTDNGVLHIIDAILMAP